MVNLSANLEIRFPIEMNVSSKRDKTAQLKSS